jgi:hypothetical protein
MHRRHPPVADAPMHPFKRATKGAYIPNMRQPRRSAPLSRKCLNRIKRFTEAAAEKFISI